MHFPLVVFPAWFFETGPLLGVPGSHWLLHRGGWAGGWGPVLSIPVPMPVLPRPPLSLLLARLKCSNCCSFSIFTQSLGVF